MDSAEQRAMIYFWYFYIIVRYVAQVLAASLFIDFLRGESKYKQKVSKSKTHMNLH